MHDKMVNPQIIKGVDGEVGAILSWDSPNPDKNISAGAGEEEIMALTANSIEVALRLLKPMPGTCKVVHTFESNNNTQTEYACTFSAYAKFPINLPAYVMGRKFIAKTQQKTLLNIKHIIENQ